MRRASPSSTPARAPSSARMAETAMHHLPTWFLLGAVPLLIFALWSVALNYAVLIRWLVLSRLLGRRLRYISPVFLFGGLAGAAGTWLLPGAFGASVRPFGWCWLLIDYTIPFLVVCLPWIVVVRGRARFSRS